MNDFGRQCHNRHYIDHTIDDIRNFLFKVVLEGQDNRKQEREEFASKTILIDS